MIEFFLVFFSSFLVTFHVKLMVLTHLYVCANVLGQQNSFMCCDLSLGVNLCPIALIMITPSDTILCQPSCYFSRFIFL